VKRIKKTKDIPEGLSPNDSAVLKQVMRRAYHLDMLFNVFGYRIGWSGLIGFIPVVGDFMSIVFSLLLFKAARAVDGGLPWRVQIQLLFNILVDFLIGLVPFVGDVVEVIYKANSRNALLLEKHLAEKGQRNIIKLSGHITNEQRMSGAVHSAASSIDTKVSTVRKGKPRKEPEKPAVKPYSSSQIPVKMTNFMKRNLDL
jgi:hypothetical protein